MTTWIILRAAGIGAYLMLFFSVAFGLVATSAPFGKRIAKQSAILIHQFMSTVGLVLLGVHICGLLLDRYIHFGPTQVLVPGTSSYRPVAVAIGVVGMYSMVLVAVSSWLRKHYSAKVWRARKESSRGPSARMRSLNKFQSTGLTRKVFAPRA